MSNSQKDKRTKEQIIRLLDHAIEQEDRLSEKIKSLEEQLAECRKKAEDPRHELTEEALSASKVSFRIDYYRTAEKGPLKGIIEHLPSRKNKAFEGEGESVITDFMSRFLVEETGNGKKRKAKKEENKPTGISVPVEVAPQPEAVMMEVEEAPAEAAILLIVETEAAIEMPEVEKATGFDEIPQMEIPEAALPAENAESPVEETVDMPEVPKPEEPGSESTLLHKLKSAIQTESGESVAVHSGTTRAEEPVSVARATNLVEATETAVGGRPDTTPVIRPSLLERVQEEYRRTLAEGSN
jgi:hypothetical protein